MTALSQMMDAAIRSNRSEYADAYAAMKWVRPDEAQAATSARSDLIDSIFDHQGAQWAFSETKLFTHALSPGCRLCGQGAWSCLFVNGICNASCFYCPTAQNDPGPPTTNSLAFDKPRDYADYVRRFGIQGVGFSGGEPLLGVKRVLAYLKAIKTRSDYPVYTWMYTNGILAGTDTLAALRDSGLDEIRFDLSANGYRLDGLEKALGVIGRVTVEIPAIPEDLPITQKLIGDLHDRGVNHLNLHQIRCTPFNARRLSDRGYTFVHGPKATVLETELTALALIRFALEQSIDLPINYCSYTYRHQFQGAAARRRHAAQIKAPWEDITPTGHIRHLILTGPEARLAGVHQTLSTALADPACFKLSSDRQRLAFAADLWPLIDFSGLRLTVNYHTAALRSGVSYRHAFKKVALNDRKQVVVEKQTVCSNVQLAGPAIALFGRLIADRDERHSGDRLPTRETSQFDGILPFESVAQGLARYF